MNNIQINAPEDCHLVVARQNGLKMCFNSRYTQLFGIDYGCTDLAQVLNIDSSIGIWLHPKLIE